MNNRWYDNEPTLSLAVSLLQNSPIENQHKCADLAIEIAMNNGVTLNNDIQSAIEYLLRRWYDEDEILAQAFEYLKNSDETLRKKIAISMIEFLQSL